MQCDFQVGDKVVCINDEQEFGKKNCPNPNVNWRDEKLNLIKGKVYTITAIGFIDLFNDVTVKLAEIPPRSGLDYGYHHMRFRKVQPKKTDISIFTQMLTKKKLTVDA